MPYYSNRNRRLRTSGQPLDRSHRGSPPRAAAATKHGQPVQPRAKQRISRVRKKKVTTGSAVKGAENRLKNFRQASILAVAITGFIMLMFAPSEAGLAQEDSTAQQEQVFSTDSVAEASTAESTAALSDTASVQQSSKESADEAIGALQNLWGSFLYNLPKILIAFVTLVLAWGLVRLLKTILQRTIGRWNSASATISLVSIAVWLLAIGVALSVVAGDIRALLGSLGLIGLALSWSLQTPIESFTGWLLNSFQGYYRVGDRVQVGDVFGDVYRIDFLTTTVWEIGSPYQSGFVQAEQPTGRMVTFPNNEVLTGTIINLTGDFPYVWDELAVAVANESDLKLSLDVLEHISENLLGHYMAKPAQKYAHLLKKAGLDDHVPAKPQAFLSLQDSWTNVIIRYLVDARERRKWKSELTLRVTQELSKPEYSNKIIAVYPRQQVQFINTAGAPVDTEQYRSNGQAGASQG